MVATSPSMHWAIPCMHTCRQCQWRCLPSCQYCLLRGWPCSALLPCACQICIGWQRLLLCPACAYAVCSPARPSETCWAIDALATIVPSAALCSWQAAPLEVSSSADCRLAQHGVMACKGKRKETPANQESSNCRNIECMHQHSCPLYAINPHAAQLELRACLLVPRPTPQAAPKESTKCSAAGIPTTLMSPALAPAHDEQAHPWALHMQRQGRQLAQPPPHPHRPCQLLPTAPAIHCAALQPPHLRHPSCLQREVVQQVAQLLARGHPCLKATALPQPRARVALHGRLER